MTDHVDSDATVPPPPTAAIAFAFHEALEAGQMDDYLTTLNYALRKRLALYDPKKPPAKTDKMLTSGHQVWVWMNGPGRPHWEVRGTGMLVRDPRRVPRPNPDDDTPEPYEPPKREPLRVTFTWWQNKPAPVVGDPYTDGYGKQWTIIEVDPRIPQRVVAEEI